MSHLKIIIIIKKETTFKQHLLYNRNPLGLLCTLRGAGEPLPLHPARTHSYGSPSHGGRHTFPFAPSSGFPRRALLSNSINAGPAGLGAQGAAIHPGRDLCVWSGTEPNLGVVQGENLASG